MTMIENNNNETPIASNRLLQWWVELVQKVSAPILGFEPDVQTAKDDAKNRLKLVLMHDRTELDPSVIEAMRSELVEVISRYVEIDPATLDLCLEQEDNMIALVANIAVVRAKEQSESGVLNPDVAVPASAEPVSTTA